MADTNLAEWTKQVAAAGVAVDKDFGKGLGKTYVKIVSMQKAFGPFLNLWLKFKTGVSALIAPMKAVLVPFGIFEKTADGIKMSFLGLIGILFTVISIFAYFTSSMGSAGGGTSELMAALGGLKDTLMGVIEQIMAFDFGPAIEMAKGVLAEFGAYFVTVATLIVSLLDWWITTWLSVVTAMWDLGVFHALLSVFEGVWVGISAIFDGFMAALDHLGITGGGTASFLSDAFSSFASFLVSSGIVDYIVSFIEVIGLVMAVAGAILGKFIELIGWVAGAVIGALGKAGAGGAFMFLLGIAKFAIGFIMKIMNAWINFIKTMLKDLLYIFTADNPFEAFREVVGRKIDWVKEKVSNLLEGPKQAISDGLSWIEGLFQDFLDFVTGIFDQIPDFGDIVDGVGGFLSDVGGSVMNVFTGSGGGIATGPQSGYPAVLHGTEAVVPLPDGRSIPVAIQGGGGVGGGANVNITVNGAKGDPDQIARAVGREVQRVFRSRSRSGGFGRGI